MWEKGKANKGRVIGLQRQFNGEEKVAKAWYITPYKKACKKLVLQLEPV